MTTQANQITQLLQAASEGDANAAEQILPLVYEELRRLAAQKLVHENVAHTLQPTALVHEAYLRLVGSEPDRRWDSRGHFYGAAAEAMRRILIDAARARGSQKRGGGQNRLPLDEELVGNVADQSEMLLSLDEALKKLAHEDPQTAELVQLRYFGGLTIDEAANVLKISARTAKRYWTFARAWLQREIESES
jgi:RNA polymerase sigma factor (TIGR02999 family)